MNTVISIDFDFWLEMPPDKDWGHREAIFFIESIWPIRVVSALSSGEDLRETCTLAPDEPTPHDMATLLADNKVRTQKNKIAVCESHVMAYKWFSRLKNLHVINIDAHHDLGYGISELNCGNWLMKLVEDGKVAKITQIYPKWRLRGINEWDQQNELLVKTLADAGVELEVLYGLKEHLPHKVFVKKMFICRSGAWVPPWLDADFRKLVYSFMYHGPHDNIAYYGQSNFESMFDRQVDWDAAEEEGRKLRQQMSKICKPRKAEIAKT